MSDAQRALLRKFPLTLALALRGEGIGAPPLGMGTKWVVAALDFFGKTGYNRCGGRLPNPIPALPLDNDNVLGGISVSE